MTLSIKELSALQESELYKEMAHICMIHGVADPDFRETHIEDLCLDLCAVVKEVIK